MAKQERAIWTRRTLLRAAAREFDRHGYTGSSLAQIARSADISMGALTFHFASKRDLADSVMEEGNAATRALVERLSRHDGPPVQYVASLTLALVDLLERDPAVRAAARLAREDSGTRHQWHALWAPAVCERLQQTPPGQKPPGTDVWAIADMAIHLVSGIEATLRHPACHEGRRDSVRRLARIWRQAVPGITLPLDARDGLPDGVPGGVVRPVAGHDRRSSHTALHPPSTGTPAPVTKEA
ncbi:MULTISPECIES: TetR/AcrR family transcriptional regulator [Streptomyces]|uniref:TetR/AcrR family transcriptional regulator n=1 Tax=Streptomyces TaxID=1883 RepID=UPI00166F9A56|nr:MULTISPECIES: TetR/AcrR family transcriptional regulator [Streptomyces]UFR05203.1 TetR/AcrR family transcriptional regulator [Streptomyces sp. Go40/10]GGT03877.1 TetR family transcriptional regulator [Streptomyces cinerochromogenes]